MVAAAAILSGRSDGRQPTSASTVRMKLPPAKPAAADTRLYERSQPIVEETAHFQALPPFSQTNER